MPANSEPWWSKAALREDLHWFAYGGRAFLLDVNSGAVCEIDGVAMALLDALAATGGEPAAAQARVWGRTPSPGVGAKAHGRRRAPAPQPDRFYLQMLRHLTLPGRPGPRPSA
jgi:hypothetical protein